MHISDQPPGTFILLLNPNFLLDYEPALIKDIWHPCLSQLMTESTRYNIMW
jgi:hypothetical protein